MRRMRQSLKRTYYLRKRVMNKDNEGNTYEAYDAPIAIQAIIRHASGKLAVEQYGNKLDYMLKMQHEDGAAVCVGDGICVYVDKMSDPDYRVISVNGLTEGAFKVYDLEAVT